MGGQSGGGTSTSSSKASVPAYVKPFATQTANQAQSLYGQPGAYPQQQTAAFTPDQLSAMGGITGMTPEQMAFLQQAQMSNAGLVGGTPALAGGINALSNIAGGYNPALNAGTGALTGVASGQDPNLQAAYAANQSLMNNPMMQAAQQANQATISGQYLDPNSNQALQAYLNAGMAPIVSNYQNAVAPNILSNAVAQGGLGSSGTAEAFGTAQSELASQLGDYAANVIYPAYSSERQLQQSAIQGAPGLLSPTESAIGNIGSLLGTQMGAAGQIPGMINPQISAASNIPGMYNPMQSAIGQAPGLSQAAYGPYGQQLGVGQQQQQQQQNVLNTLFQNQMTPYQMLTSAANLIGPLAGGGGQSFQVSNTPGGSMK